MNAAVGLWLMAAPAVLGYGGAARTNDRIVGPVAAAVAVIAVWEASRSLRWANVGAGLWLVLAPWFLDYGALPLLHSTAAGFVLMTFAVIPGRMTARLGGGWGALLPGRRVPPEEGG